MERPLTIVATVGLNLLPVRIAAEALIRRHPASRLVLLCSTESEQEATAIKAQVPSAEPTSVVPLNLDDAREVQRVMRQYSGDQVHLHYTGGFKLAGLAAFAALGRKCEHSYLDPHDFTLMADPPMPQPEVSLTLEQLAGLHGWVPEREKELPTREEVTQRFHSGERVTHEWMEGCAYYALREAFPELPPGSIWSERNVKHIASGRSCNIDASAVSGWRLLNVSCTGTEEAKPRGQVAMKTFEAIFRARQLGGVASRAAVLCMVTPVDALTIEEDVRDHTDITREALRVISLQHCRQKEVDPVTEAAKFLKPLLTPQPSPGQPCAPTPALPNVRTAHQIFATVGGNPLPVTVSLLYLLQQEPDAGVVLLCTPESKEQAKTILAELQRSLDRKHDGDCHVVCSGSPDATARCVSKLTCQPGKTFNFNCTGGQKSHAFYAFKAFPEVPDYHYLSPTTHVLMGPNGPTGDLRRFCSLDLEALASLHGFEIVGQAQLHSSKKAALAELQKAAENKGCSFHIGARFKKRNGKRMFQLEACIIKGYQLGVIQLDREPDVGDIKLHAIETLIRARQIGGDLATVLYFAPETPGQKQSLQDIESELSDLINPGRKPVRMWPWNDQTNLQYRLEQFLSEAMA